MPMEEEPRSARSGLTDASESLGPESARLCHDDEAGEDLEECGFEALKDDSKDTGQDQELSVVLPLEPLNENIYGFVMASLIKDTADVYTHPEHCMHSLRPIRIVGAFILCLMMFGMQAFFVIEAKRLVTPNDVKRARIVYGAFEDIMYTDGNGTKHTWNTSNGFPRGYDGFYNETNFDKLSHDDKAAVCRVPLSQPRFLFGVLFIWSLTVLHHMRNSVNLIARILLAIKTIDTMELALRRNEDTGEDQVVGLSLPMKISLLLFVQFPRMIMNAFLLWLGARWLTATLGFGDLLLNALALEFILNLSGLLYDAMVPYNGKLLVQRTLLPHLHPKEKEDCCNMFGMFSCGIIAAVFCLCYMTWLQAVLPFYKWDIHQVCKEFLELELAV